MFIKHMLLNIWSFLSSAQCVLRSVYFSAQPNKVWPILKFEFWHPIEHIFVPACSSVRKVHFFLTFLWFWNFRPVISPKICPCILRIFPKYAPVSPLLLIVLDIYWIYIGHKRYRGITLNKVHIVHWRKTLKVLTVQLINPLIANNTLSITTTYCP